MIIPALPHGPLQVMVRTWSHTDRRQMLSLEETLIEGVSHGILTPAGAALSKDEEENEDAIRARCLKNDPLKSEDMRYAAVSWSPRAPKRLRVESCHMALVRHCDNWAEFVAGQCTDKHRRFYRLFIEKGTSV